MENEHKHRVVAWWSSGQTALAKSDSAPNAIHFAAPPTVRWPGRQVDPRGPFRRRVGELLHNQVRPHSGQLEIDYNDLEAEAEGTVTKTGSGKQLQRDCASSQSNDSQ
jgi:hypothetical protein